MSPVSGLEVIGLIPYRRKRARASSSTDDRSPCIPFLPKETKTKSYAIYDF